MAAGCWLACWLAAASDAGLMLACRLCCLGRLCPTRCGTQQPRAGGGAPGAQEPSHADLTTAPGEICARSTIHLSAKIIGDRKFLAGRQHLGVRCHRRARPGAGRLVIGASATSVGEGESAWGGVLVRPGLQRKPCCAGNRGLSDGVRTFNHAATSRRETATSPPAPSSQCNVFTRSESQGQGPLCRQLSCAMKAGRVEKRVMCCVVGDSINDEDRHVVPGLSQPLVWVCDMQYVVG